MLPGVGVCQACPIRAERTVAGRGCGVVEAEQNCGQSMWLHCCQKYLSLLKIFISLYMFKIVLIEDNI